MREGSEVDVNGTASNNDEAVEVVPFAADRLLSARVVTKTKRSHWRALESDKNILAKDKSKKPKNRADDGAAGFSNAVAALDRTGIARVRDARRTAPSRS
jgi:hypothetical protein